MESHDRAVFWRVQTHKRKRIQTIIFIPVLNFLSWGVFRIILYFWFGLILPFCLLSFLQSVYAMHFNCVYVVFLNVIKFYWERIHVMSTVCSFYFLVLISVINSWSSIELCMHSHLLGHTYTILNLWDLYRSACKVHVNENSGKNWQTNVTRSWRWI